MEKTDVTRRQLLAGLAGAGGIGTVVGTGTASVFSDETLFRRSGFGSGRLDLAVDWETDGRSGDGAGQTAIPVDVSPADPRQTVHLTVSLPNGDGSNTPATAWLRAVCPDDGQLAVDPLVTVRYEDCQSDCVAHAGPLSSLAAGVGLSPDGETAPPAGRACLDPGQEIELAMDVGVTDVREDASASFTLEFRGVQCRNREPTNPFWADPADAASADCESNPSPGRPDVDALTFCTSQPGDIRPSIVATRPGDDGPGAVIWETAVDVDVVGAVGADELTVYDFRETDRTAGAAWVGDPAATIESVPFDPAADASPSAIAHAELPGAVPGSMRSVDVRYDDAGDRWEVVAP